jgi:hypothetical protein
VNRLRAVLRRLDAWAALVLGLLVALGVIILLATPGPWHVVVKSTPQVPLVTPPPSDIAVFVNGTSVAGRCTGVLWLRLDYQRPSLTCVVVPARLDTALPGGGFEPLSRVVRDAGPAEASRALGATLGVEMGAWVYLGRSTLRVAFPDMTKGIDTRAGRAGLRSLRQAWGENRDARRRFALQTAYVNRALAGSSWADLNLVAFVNYLLAAPDVDSDLRLQGASAIGTVLKTAPPRRVVVGALPAVELRCGSYSRWVPQRLPLLALKRAFAFGATVPVYRPVVTREPVPPRVLVVTSPSRAALLQAYRSGLERALLESSGRAVGVRVVAVASPLAALPIVERTVDEPPLAVVVAVGRQRPAVPEGIEQGMLLLLGALAKAGQPTVVSEVPSTGDGLWAAVNGAIATAAEKSGTPFSPVAPLLSGGGPSGATVDEALFVRWGMLNAEALVRAVEPGYFAPDLRSTRTGFDYYQRTKTSVAVVGRDDTEVARQVAMVANLGFAATPAAPGDASETGYRALHYRSPALGAALILADELLIPAAAVTASPPPTSTELALVVP